MRVLLDESIPRRLKNELTAHDVATVTEQGWQSKSIMSARWATRPK